MKYRLIALRKYYITNYGLFSTQKEAEDRMKFLKTHDPNGVFVIKPELDEEDEDEDAE